MRHLTLLLAAASLVAASGPAFAKMDCAAYEAHDAQVRADARKARDDYQKAAKAADNMVIKFQANQPWANASWRRVYQDLIEQEHRSHDKYIELTAEDSNLTSKVQKCLRGENF
jgi:hypothetical protein